MDLTSIKPGDNLVVTADLVKAAPDSNSWTYYRSQSKLQHEIWNHGNELLSKSTPSQQDFAAALIQFQRAVELRDKLLDRLYGFENIPGIQSSGKYTVMADLGIIRPNLKIRLRELRNTLMHSPDEIPLKKTECDFLADTAWYYLKVTDRIAEQYADEIAYEYTTSQTDRSFATIKVQPGSWNIGIDARLAANHLREAGGSHPLTIEVQACEFVRYSESLHLRGKVTGAPLTVWSMVKDFFVESIL